MWMRKLFSPSNKIQLSLSLLANAIKILFLFQTPKKNFLKDSRKVSKHNRKRIIEDERRKVWRAGASKGVHTYRLVGWRVEAIFRILLWPLASPAPSLHRRK